jgi:hypothetical protein
MVNRASVDRRIPPQAAVFPLAAEVVHACLDLSQPVDRAFARACKASLSALSPAERRGALPGVTGHVAESVVEVLLAGLGYQLLWHFAGPGRHGVDLLVLCPQGERVVAVEVKGTLRQGHWPRMSSRELAQMSAAWVDKRDNPGMANWELGSQDVYGAVVLVNFATMAYRAAFTADFLHLHPVMEQRQLADLEWLDHIPA